VAASLQPRPDFGRLRRPDTGIGDELAIHTGAVPSGAHAYPVTVLTHFGLRC
jgi:hypothetical protein